MLWLCLRFPLLPLEVFTRAGMHAQRPVIVTEKHRVLCHDALAGEHGVSPGISASTAQALCPGLLTLERRKEREAAALLGLADWGYRFTSLLALEPPDSLLLEVSGSLRLFGGLERLLRQVEDELTERGHAHLDGLAPTPAGAALLARARPCTPADIPPWCANGDLAAFRAGLGELPLDLLEVPDRQRLRMQRMGFSRIGALLALPRAALGKRFGHEFLDRLQRLGGEKPDPRLPHQPRDFFHAELQFLEPLHHSTMLLFPAQRLLRELGQFLDRRQCFCQRLDWRLRDISGRTLALGLPCSLAHNSHAALIGLTRLKFESLRLAEPAESLALVCRDFAPVHQQSAALFPDADEDAEQAGRLLLDRLAIRLGEGCVHGIGTADAHLPEHAWRSTQGGGGAASGATSIPAQRPSWLLPEPLPLARDAQGLRWHGRLQLLSGPERIESDWWATGGNRDYFIARHEQNGTLCWVFRDHHSRRWFLHGLFG